MSTTLKTNTAIRMVVGPFIDKTDGFTLKTGMTVTNLAMNLWQEHDDGSAPTKVIDGVYFTVSGGSNDMIELSDGFYEIELTAAQLNFIGRAKFQIYDIDVILPYFESWQVVSMVDYEAELTPLIPIVPSSGDMIKAFYYATVAEIRASLKPESGGNEVQILQNIKSASEFILRRPKLGQFIPSTEIKRFDGNGKDIIDIPPILQLASITVDGESYAATDTILNPLNRHWQNGPYSCISHDPDGTKHHWKKVPNGIVITGAWGKYNVSEDTGQTVQNDPLAADGTDLIVLDGSKISPGMVLLIGAEQALVTGTKDPTENVTTLSTAVDQITEAFTLADETLVNKGELLRFDLEDVLVKGKNATTHQIYVKRGYNDTAKVAHEASTPVDVYRTFSIIRGVNGTTAVEHAKDTAISRYKPPEQINTLCKQIACNLQGMDETGYRGKAGNAQQGEEYYYVFPRDADLAKYEEQFNLWE
jgi:hypothetical protein